MPTDQPSTAAPPETEVSAVFSQTRMPVALSIEAMLRRRNNLLARSITAYMASLAMAIGLGTALLWLFQPEWVLWSVPLLFQAKFNTSICMFVSSLGLWALLLRKTRVALGCALFVALLTFVILLEYIFGINIGIDELVARDQVSMGSAPGRMSINSICCFLIFSAVILLCLPEARPDLQRVAMALLFGLFAICLVALGGYFSDVPLVYTWGSYAQLSPQSAVGFLALAIGASSHIWLHSPRHLEQMPLWVPGLYTLLVFWFDLSTPLGVAAGIAYVPLVFFALGLRAPAMVFVLAAIASILTIAGYFLSPFPAAPLWIVLLNRALSIGAVWFTALIVFISRSESLAREDSERHLRAVVNTVLDGLVAIDQYGTIQRLNPAAQRMFGYSEQEVVGRNVKMLMPEPYHGEHDAYLHNYHVTGEKRIIGIGREVEARRKDGSTFPIELGVGETVISGRTLFVGTIRDVSRRKEAEREIQDYVAALQRSNQDLDDFAYIASHDLKEPLRGLANNARFLEEDYADKLEANGRKRISRLLYLCHRMERLVDDLLYFSRLGRQEQAIREADPNRMVADIESMMESWLQENNARIVVPRPMPRIRCDVARVTEVFRNLITNGVKYNDKDEKIVEIGSFMKDGDWVFYVKDNGIGIAPEFHEEIFRIFKRLNTEDDSSRGSGVGLTFVRKIVERHNGHVWVESAPGAGSTFLFTLNKPVHH